MAVAVRRHESPGKSRHLADVCAQKRLRFVDEGHLLESDVQDGGHLHDDCQIVVRLIVFAAGEPQRAFDGIDECHALDEEEVEYLLHLHHHVIGIRVLILREEHSVEKASAAVVKQAIPRRRRRSTLTPPVPHNRCG